VTSRTNLVVVVSVLCLALCSPSFAQVGMNTFTGLNTVQYRLNATAAPDVNIAVGLTEYCEHVNNAYQCWYKGGPNANQPVNFLGSTSPKSDSGPWSQNSNNNGNTPHCPTAYTPNSQLIHDNVYNVWILEKRVTAAGGGHNYMCVAISNIDDVSQSSFAWFAFEFDLDTVIPTNSKGNFYYPDYPQVGLWQSSTSTVPPYTAAKDQALWISYDLMDGNSANNINGVLLCAVDLAGLRASTANPWVNNSKLPACTVAHPLTAFNQRRSWVPAKNVDTTPPVSADGEMFTYVIEPPKDGKSYLTDPNHTQGIEQWTIDWTSGSPIPSFVNSWDLPSTQPAGDQSGCFNPSSYYNTSCVPQPSTGSTGIHIDSVADRMSQPFQYTSARGQGSVWTSARTIQISPSSTSRGQTEADIRVLQRNAAAPNSIYVAGDYPVTDPSDPNAYVFIPGIARDRAGNLQGIFGVSGTGINEHPGLQSLLFNPGTSSASTYGYIVNPGSSGDAEDTDNLNYRWGDWFSAVVDPADSCTVWVAGEYLQGNRTTEPFWYTEIASLPPASTCAGGPVLLSNVSLNFGTNGIGTQSAALVETVTNNQSVSLNISGISITSAEYTETDTCQGQPVAPQGTCTISVYFKPSTSGVRPGSLLITDDASTSPHTIALAGTGASSSISVSPTTLAFGSQALSNSTAGQNITVTNSGFSDVTISSVLASGSYSETDTCSGTLIKPGQNCNIIVTFTPAVTGSIPGTITITDNAAGSPQLVTLSGSGVVPVSFSGNLTFPAVNVGSSSVAQTMTMTNNLNQALNLTFTTSGNFSAAGNGTAPCGVTIAAKTKCTFGVTFSPTTNGLIKGSLVVSYNTAGSPAVGYMQGTGQNGPTAPLTFTPGSLSFGNVALNTSSSKIVTVKNVTSSAITINSVTALGYYSVVPSGTTPCTGTVNAGKTCTMTVTFTPLATGTTTAGITVADTAATSTQVQNANGTGVLPVTMSPASVSFGTVSVGSTSAVQAVTVTNNQTSAAPIDSIVPSGDFIYTTGGSSPCTTTIPASGTCTLGVEFSPSSTGSISGSLTLTYGAAFSPVTVSLSGTGQ
jgi:Abnormal spindle-like microcephaly-assoc'd, ASPM-SPD-2-Hydin